MDRYENPVRAGYVTQLTECLLSMHEALCSVLIITKAGRYGDTCYVPSLRMWRQEDQRFKGYMVSYMRCLKRKVSGDGLGSWRSR